MAELGLMADLFLTLHFTMEVVKDFTYKITDLVTGYRHRNKQNVLLNGMNACLLRNELTCLIGVNGAGKSTLLRTMAGLQPAMAGNVELLGKPLAEYKPTELAKKVSVVLTDEVPEQNLTALELVSMGRLPYTGYWGALSDADSLRVAEVLEMVGMSKFANRRLSSLSDGERQKLMIAKALAQDTDVILLDEPVAFLDFPSKVAVLRLLRHIALTTNKSVLLSIHDIEIALQTSQRLWVLTDRGFLCGEPRELAKNGEIDFLFSGQGIKFDHETLQYSLT